MLFFVMKLMRRMYMYTQTSSVSSTVAKKGPKIAVCAMPSYSLAFSCFYSLTEDKQAVQRHKSDVPKTVVFGIGRTVSR
jgi:hypothetical protein